MLSETGATRTPNFLLPKNFHNEGNYIVSLGNVVRWLAQQAEALGVEIFPGFPAAEVLYNEDGKVRGVATGNMGDRQGRRADRDFQLGMELHGKYTVFAEGARGHLGRQLIAKYKLDAGKDPQSYGIGIKELWEIDPAAPRARPGDAHRGLAAARRHLRRLLPLSRRKQPADRRLRGRPGLPEPVPEPLRGVPALQDASQHPLVFRRPGQGPEGAQATELRRARHHRGRPAVAAQDGVPGRRAGRLRCRLPQREPHQGQPCRDQDRHAGGRSRVRPRSWPAASTTNSPPIRPRSRRAGCTRNCTGRATSSRGSRRA